MGSVPSFLTQNNLTTAGDTAATKAVTPPSESSTPATSSAAAVKGVSLMSTSMTMGGVVVVTAMSFGAGMVW